MGITRCSFTCLISSITSERPDVVSTYQQHLRQEEAIAKKLILTLRAIMISQEVDLVASDFNGTSGRCRSRNNLSTIEEAFTDSPFPTTPGPPPPLWGPGSIPDIWADV